MFREAIRTTALTTPAADAFYDKITGSTFFNGDMSLLATMRALLHSRCNGERIAIAEIRANWTERQRESYSIDHLFGNLLTPYLDLPNLFLVSIANTKQTYDDIVGKMDSLMGKYHYRKVESVTALFHKNFAVMCYVCDENQTTLLVTEPIDLRKFHYMQCALLGMMPWYFNPGDTVSELEMQLIYSLRKDSPEEYLACLETIASQQDFETTRLRTLLENFETTYERAQIDNIESAIERMQEKIRNYYDEIAGLNRDLRQRRSLLSALLSAVKDASGSELMSLFMGNDSLYLDNVDDTKVVFATKQYYDNFDPDAVSAVLRNRNSVLYRNCSTIGITEDGMEKLIRAVFLDRSVRLRVCAAYFLDCRGRSDAYNSYNFPSGFENYMPNPHVQRYRCLGGYRDFIVNMVSNCDYAGAVIQCIESCKSLNFEDSTVIAYFCEEIIHNRDKKWFEFPDGTLASAMDVILWQDEKDNEG